ncbi:hypothetical protein H828_YJM1478B00323 [Saccharomyces cerevisiae YJM1478]|uniref:5'-deoxynucleotidase YBR242W n=6 Tax=Saccharomyces TaxID=4930 RepID=YB92_YEAST|nr:5'-deoxynucleotidase [Saccharomyces cerevisiae S288C]P38331.1 RecName: Full=5'-deoxynucleotidase YBR242W [Saccharomyces cerevisiae S288C]AAT92634.1 YBR242W [Saccharomyces cerevisiae]AJP37316.1 hypothetical protein F842_YJM1078B00351 [Saccharomyces cerevisiae YJM1078]AJP87937.1 hypothetical protein H828_YJM1478B00323 [Saccharomyces cerevisiae YJM1478]AJP88704.1 hypothetical protein H830_YJM1526B00351 [Saccharomyces cerevisiae YJM1526]AJP90174.1 hypothetical protein H834_YJM1574B00277 [Sacch|eukprot:NP_009801.1 hypothetical protein YBR242W [Saccharomyces cerevisiae S288C]
MTATITNKKSCSGSVEAGKTRLTTEWKPESQVPQYVKNELSKPHPNYILAFLNVVQQLKIQRRTGYLDLGIKECESISDHMYRLSIITMLIKDSRVNRDKCVRIALVHDIAESLVGDITPVDPIGKEEKHRREWETIKYLCNALIKPYNEIAAKEIMDDWLAYENVTSLEARYVKDIDKYEMLVQCFEYEREYKGTKNFDDFFGAVASIKTDEVKGWTSDLVVQRQKYFADLTQSITK